MPRTETTRRLGLALLAALVLLQGWATLTHASTSVGGADSSGYLNAAKLFASGEVIVPVRGLEALDLEARWAYALRPLGFIPGPEPGTSAPYYPPGLPMHIAALASLVGWDTGPFVLLPVVGLLGLLVAYALARELGLTPPLAAGAAALLATWPVYLWGSVQLMSDVLATLWVMLAVLGALRSRSPGWSAISGAAFVIAVTIRPANVLAAIPLAFSLQHGWKTWGAFLAGGLPFGLPFLAYNHVAYGGPFTTGYSGHLATDLQWAHFPERARHYAFWLTNTLTPIMPIAWLTSVFSQSLERRKRAMLISWFAVYFLFYCFYRHYDTWWYLRFLAPGVPAVILAATIVIRDVTVGAPSPIRRAFLGFLFAGLVAAGVVRAADLGAFDVHRYEAVYPNGVAMAEAALPERAIVAAMQMSGALEHYSDLPSVRPDRLQPEAFRELRQLTERRGYVWYALLFPFEIPWVKSNLPANWQLIDEHRQVSLWRLAPRHDSVQELIPVPTRRRLLELSRSVAQDLRLRGTSRRAIREDVAAILEAVREGDLAATVERLRRLERRIEPLVADDDAPPESAVALARTIGELLEPLGEPGA